MSSLNERVQVKFNSDSVMSSSHNATNTKHINLDSS